MQNEDQRVLGRVLAVEEVRAVHGASGRDTFTGDPEGVPETSPTADVTLPADDTSNPQLETAPEADSGTATDTGVSLDCSGTRRDVFIGDIDCP
ncbi:MAG: hypothetical protein E6Q50_16635 [Lysobacter sp.]|jgi:hypothetical protein|nr:MAG: hypothetical protein E6Q50_16635 [Lysobacter sp.]